MANVSIEFWCFVEGDTTAFPVTVSSTMSIGHLKNEIKEQGINPTDHEHAVLAKDLTLWKVINDIPLKPSNTLVQRIGNLGQDYSQFAEELYSTDSVAEAFPEAFKNLGRTSTSGFLHVIVQLPTLKLPSVLGKRFRATDDPELNNTAPTQPGWLEEIYSKLWNRPELKPALFRKVVVTRGDYDTLQDILNQKFTERDSAQYDGGHHDVLSDKLDFLRSLSPGETVSPHTVHNDGPDAITEDDFEINSFFPSFMNYLDLSTLGLKSGLNRMPMPVYLRHEYDHISELIKKRPQNSDGSFIISGQPGTGKTAYLYVRIIESLIEGRPFLYQTSDRTVYHVTHAGVKEIQSSWSPEAHIVAFIDGDEADNAPKPFILNAKVQIIVASSPKVTNQKWIKQAAIAVFTQLATSLWSAQELFLTGIFLHKRDVSSKRLMDSTSYFGYNPRQCFDASYSEERLKMQKETVMKHIIQTAGNSNQIIESLHKYQMGADHLSHRIFQTFPTNESRNLQYCNYEPLSSWVYENMLKICEAHEADAAARLYVTLSGMSWTASFRGIVFEKQILRYLDSIDADRPLPIRRLGQPDETPWSYPGPIPRRTFKEPTVIQYIKDAVKNRTPLHLVPFVPNFPAIDSILYHPDRGLTFFQITINSDHPIAVSCLKRIERWLNERLPVDLTNLHPSKRKPWRFIFIVPPEMASDFKPQELDGDTEMDVWVEKVDQFVLGLEGAIEQVNKT